MTRPLVGGANVPPGLHHEPVVVVVVNVHHSFIVRGHLSSCFILNLLTENDSDVVNVVSATHKAVSGSDDEPGDVVSHHI